MSVRARDILLEAATLREIGGVPPEALRHRLRIPAVVVLEAS